MVSINVIGTQIFEFSEKRKREEIDVEFVKNKATEVILGTFEMPKPLKDDLIEKSIKSLDSASTSQSVRTVFERVFHALIEHKEWDRLTDFMEFTPYFQIESRSLDVYLKILLEGLLNAKMFPLAAYFIAQFKSYKLKKQFIFQVAKKYRDTPDFPKIISLKTDPDIDQAVSLVEMYFYDCYTSSDEEENFEAKEIDVSLINKTFSAILEKTSQRQTALRFETPEESACSTFEKLKKSCQIAPNEDREELLSQVRLAFQAIFFELLEKKQLDILAILIEASELCAIDQSDIDVYLKHYCSELFKDGKLLESVKFIQKMGSCNLQSESILRLIEKNPDLRKFVDPFSKNIHLALTKAENLLKAQQENSSQIIGQ